MEVRVLGPLEVREGATSLPLGGLKQRAVLALLVLDANRTVSTARLIDGIWGEDPPATAANALQVYVSNLRKVLDRRRLVTEGPGYSLRVEPEEADLVRLGELLATGRGAAERRDWPAAARAFRDALGSWRGDALMEFEALPFAATEVARLEDLRAQTAEDLVDAELALGRHAEVLDELERLADRHPLRERLRGQWMLAAYRSGRQDDALRIFARTRALLVEELGIDPSPALQELHAKILAQDPDMAAPARTIETPHTLPAQPTSFVGREHEQARVRAMLDDGARLVTLTGPGGSGKTRLSIEVARSLLADRPGGVWFADLAPLGDASLVPSTIAGAMRLAVNPTEPLLEQITTAIGASPALVVLDNCEHLIDGCAETAAVLLARTPAASILATSRERLGIAGEHVMPVEPLGVPGAATTPEELAASDAARLFLDRARAVSPDLVVHAGSVRAIARICAGLDGLPLALELAAVRCATMSFGELADALDDRFALLAGGSRTALPRQRTLRALVSWSHDLLSDDERALFAACSVFAGAVDAETIAGVCRTGAATRDLLDGLVAKSLIVADPSRERTRFRMLETLRLYAAEQLAAAGRAEDMWRGHCVWFTERAEHWRAQGAPGVDAIEHELDDMRAALDWAALNDGELELRLVNGMTDFWRTRGLFQEGRQRSIAAVRRAPEEPTRALALALLSMGTFTYPIAEYEEAREAYGRCLEVARGIGLEHGVAVSHNGLGGIASQEGDLAAARTHFEAAREQFEGLGDKRSTALVLNNLATVLSRLGDQATAGAHLDRAVELLADDDTTRAIALTSRGDLRRIVDDHDAAERDHTEALALARGSGNPMIEAANLMGLGMAIARREPTAGREMVARGTTIAREIGVTEIVGFGVTHGGELALAAGDLDAARTLLAEAARLSATRGDRYAMATGLLIIAAVAHAAGDDARASLLLAAAEHLRERLGAAFVPSEQRMRSALREALDPVALADAAARVPGMSMADMVACAEEGSPPTQAGGASTSRRKRPV